MRSADRRLLLALFLLSLTPLLSASRATSDTVIVRAEDVVTEDFHVAANNVEVDGVIEGDLVATAFQTVRIEGTVHGDVQIIASQVEISGSVAGGARIVADRITIGGTIGDDAVLIGRTILVSGEIGRDLLLWGIDAGIRGSVVREAVVAVLDDAVVGGRVGAGAEVIAASIRFESGASFGSGVRARSDSISGEDVVDGRVTVPSELPTQLRVRALLVSGALAAVAFMIALWMSMFWLAPATVRRSIGIAEAELSRAFTNGLWVLVILALVLVGPPVVGLIGFPEAALGVYVFGGPLFLLFAAAVLLAWFVGAIPVATVLGGRIVRSASPLSAFVVGVAVLALLAFIPFVRWLLLPILTTGVGALWLGASRNRGSVDWLRVPPVAE